MRARILEMTRFLSVGGVSFVVDVGLMNLLRFGPGHVLEHKPLTARIIAVGVATLVSWVGNRNWTFASHRTARRGRELMLYSVINIIGVLIAVGALWFSHYVLDLRSPLVDNISTIIGIGLGTVVRYIGYKTLVFVNPAPAAPTTAPTAPTAPTTAPHGFTAAQPD